MQSLPGALPIELPRVGDASMAPFFFLHVASAVLALSLALSLSLCSLFTHVVVSACHPSFSSVEQLCVSARVPVGCIVSFLMFIVCVLCILSAAPLFFVAFLPSRLSVRASPERREKKPATAAAAAAAAWVVVAATVSGLSTRPHNRPAHAPLVHESRRGKRASALCLYGGGSTSGVHKHRPPPSVPPPLSSNRRVPLTVRVFPLKVVRPA